ncbi:TetR/AcrR family transcriptional regulator [Amycolatopsis anabasis]|uniref:TetR/AcrR family transcriptional regulator n=1 Tax=Amycolatopsis anabasis TaxID=1840409 RepID=UPI00131CFFEB|nr:TetR/AcrR family transcriptional regulator [Amycolatopsis anabasis]
METSSLRVYGGVTGDDRQADRRAQFIEAGLDLLGAGEGEPNLTVRGVCKHTGLAARYFYESFPDRDALALAVFDHVVEGIATTTLAAVRTAEPSADAKVRAGLTALVRRIAEDPRRGRLLFSPALNVPALLRRRAESTRMFVQLLGLQAQEFYDIPDSARLALLAEFLVGGLAQTLTAWLDGTLPLAESDVVDQCTRLFLTAGELR